VIVNHLSKLLGERRMKVADLARATGVSGNALYDWYSGRVRRFDADTLDRICTALGVGVADILEHRPDQAATQDVKGPELERAA
jgi:putative transcriptional regulator